jgi:protocatechuate 3,4-dioxygenase beta subunit
MKMIREFLLVFTATVLLSANLRAQAQERAVVQIAPDTSTNTPTLKCTGMVTDAAGSPVAGATVEYWCYEGNVAQPRDPVLKKQVITSADGAYEFQTSQNTGVLLARKSGLAHAWLELNRTIQERKLVMTPPGTLAGVVVDDFDKPVVNAEIYLTGGLVCLSRADGSKAFNYLGMKPMRNNFSARTDANGYFKIENLPNNAYVGFAIHSPGKALRPGAREFIDPETGGYRVGQEEIKLMVEPAGNVEGKIIGGETNQPWPVPRLSLEPDLPGYFMVRAPEPEQSVTDGLFRIKDVPAGSYRLRAVFGTNALPDWVADIVPVVVEVGKTTSGVQVMATRGGLLEVSVLGKSDRKPLPQVHVNAYKKSFQSTAISDNNGVARLRLPSGDYQIFASRQSIAENQISIRMEVGRTNSLEIELASPRQISGIVSTPDGRPAVGISVRIVSGFGPGPDDVKTDANGRFELTLNQRGSTTFETAACLLVRDPDHNLAVAQDVDEDTGPINLQVAPALTLVGRVESNGKPITNVTARLIFHTGRIGFWLRDLARTNTPGQYEIPALPPGRKYGIVVSAPGYGQVSIFDIGASPDAVRRELDPVELKPANLRLAGQVLDVDDKPVAGCNVSLNGEGQPNANMRTDREGRFYFEHVCEGSIQLSGNNQKSYGNISTEGGETNVVLRLDRTYTSTPDSKLRKLTGTVTDADGQPAAGAQLAVLPPNEGLRWVKAGTNGTFSLNWLLRSYQSQSGSSLLVVRDTARNLAATADLPEEITNLEVKLKPALTLVGQVKSTTGSPLPGAQVGLWLKAGNTYYPLNEQTNTADTQGRFEITCLPPESKYTIFATAKGHSRSQQQIEPDTETHRIELTAFVLKLADHVLAGQVINEKEKPVSGAHVRLSGKDQPESNLTTDSKGRFRFQVCEGPVLLFATAQSAYAQATAEAGDTNVVMTLSSRSGNIQAPRRASFKGSVLPDLASVNLASDAVSAGKPVLLCLFDAGQRPSRHVMRQLNEQMASLQQRNVCVIGVQTAVISDETFNEWKSASPVAFPLGRVTDKSDKSQWASTVTTLPWLILTDANHQVIAEGFAFDELDTRVQKLGSN